ncbi:MAG TPA: alpha/beta hydrolase [Burkholderiaceae bacterium]|nr:alpha/beta hydrolase [Burkholderiaceae bacterium]
MSTVSADVNTSSPEDMHRRMAYWDWSSASGNEQHVVICVHGLSRQSRDFDVLASALRRDVRVICPDVAGRGHSDWLQDPMAYQLPTYVQDMVALISQLREQGVHTIDWVGTSMGGLIGVVVAAQPELNIRRLVLNDVGPTIEAAALLRIGCYLGKDIEFQDMGAAASYLWEISRTFGPHSEQEWLDLSAPMLREKGDKLILHYDPKIAVPFRALTAESAQAVAEHSQAAFWGLYECIQSPTLLLRGAESDLLSRATAQRMTEAGPCATCVEFAGVGHAPTLVSPDQVDLVATYLLAA